MRCGLFVLSVKFIERRVKGMGREGVNLLASSEEQQREERLVFIKGPIPSPDMTLIIYQLCFSLPQYILFIKTFMDILTW